MANLPVMQDDRVHWNGQPVAVVLAETQEQADHAATLIAVDLRAPSRPVSTSTPPRPRRSRPEHILGEPAAIEVGDAEAALRGGPPPGRPDLPHPAPQPQRHRAARGHRRVGRRRPLDRARRDAGAARHPGDARRRVRARRGPGARDARRSSAAASAARCSVEPPDPGHRGGEARRPAGAAGAVARGRVSGPTGGRTTTEQRVALAARADGSGLAALIHTGVAARQPHNDCPEQFTFPARHLYAARMP